MEKNVIEKSKNAVFTEGSPTPSKSLIHKRLSLRNPWFVAVLSIAVIGLLLFLGRTYYNLPIPVSKTKIVEDSIVLQGKTVAIAPIQVAYKQAFKHLKRMDVYYREARDLLLGMDYEAASKKCDSALLHKIDKPLNWSPQKWGDVYNIKAESLLYLGKTEEAETAAIQALKMDKQDKLGYLHLMYAQILAEKYKRVTPLFLENFKFALKKNLPVEDYMELTGFENVKKDPSVKKLLSR